MFKDRVTLVVPLVVGCKESVRRKNDSGRSKRSKTASVGDVLRRRESGG